MRKIPPTLHMLWTTDNAFLERYHPLRISWMYFNPEWNSKFWRIADLPLDKFPKIARDLLLNPKLRWVIKTDIIRWFIIWLEGGIYADCDVECCKSMDRFLEDEAFCGRSYHPNNIGNAVVGCVPGNKLMYDIGMATCEAIAKDIDAANKNVVDCTVNLAGKMLKKCPAIYPVEFFYPYSWGHRIENNVKPKEHYKNSYTIHHWSGVEQGGWVWEEREAARLEAAKGKTTFTEEDIKVEVPKHVVVEAKPVSATFFGRNTKQYKDHQQKEEAEARRKESLIKTTIKIGIPSFDGKFWPDVDRTMEEIEKAPEWLKIVVDKSHGVHQYCLYQARNMLLYGGRQWWPKFVPPYDYFLSMDDDNGITMDGILALVRVSKANDDKCIVSAAYRGRHGDTVNKLVAGYFDESNGGHKQIPVSYFISWKESDFPKEVDIVGGGSCLIPKKVIMALPAPLYQHEDYALPNDSLHRHQPLNEDQALCRAVKKAGFKVLLTNVISTHRGEKI